MKIQVNNKQNDNDMPFQKAKMIFLHETLSYVVVPFDCTRVVWV